MTRRLRDEWGSITEVERGKRYRIRYWGADDDGIYRRMSCTVRGTKRDAEKKRAELMLRHSDERQTVTIDYIWSQWYLPFMMRKLEDKEMSEKTVSQRRSKYRSIIKDRWGDVPCDGVKPLLVQQWLDTETFNSATAAMGILRPMLDYAVRYGQIDSNPFREKYVMPSKSSVSRKDDGIWTLDELGVVWDAVRGEWYEGAFLCAAYGGMRVGESMGVMVSDINMHQEDGLAVATVHVQRQVLNSGGVSDRLKNPQSNRTAVIVGEPAARLSEIAEAASTWVCGDGFGNHTKQARLSKAWRSLADRLPDGLWHPYRNLRNGYQTFMRWEVGLAPYYIEELLGHKGSSVTDLYYDRPTPEIIASMTVSAWKSYLCKKNEAVGGGNDQ